MAYRQHKATLFTGGSGSVTFDSDVLAGSTIVVCVGRNGLSERSFTVSDGVNTYTDVLNQTGLNNLEVYMVRSFGVAGGPVTITVTASGTTNASIAAIEITSQNSVGAQAIVDEAGSSTSHVNSNPALSIGNSAFVVMMSQAGGGYGTITHPSGYTQITGVSGTLLVEYREFASATTNDAAWSSTTSRQVVNCHVSFVAAGGGGGSPLSKILQQSA